MLKPIRKESNQVADGRKFAARSIVMTSLAAIECYVFRRKVVPVNNTETRNQTIYAGAVVLSSQEEHATEYEELGYAKMLFDHFSGGSLHNDMDDINSGDSVFTAQIEPFDIAFIESQRAMIRHLPEWLPQKGDVFALIIDEDTIKWLECIGSSGQTIHADYGNKYMLNLRDSLEHLEPFISQDQLLKPENNLYPMLFSDLLYNDAPLFDVDEQDPGTKMDDQVTMRKFKLANILDQTFEREMAVMSIKSIQQRSNSPYFFTENDTKSITVSLQRPDTFLLNATGPVKAIQVNNSYITYMLIVIDHAAVIQEISADLKQNMPVKLKQGSLKAFDILPSNFNEKHKFYTVIVMADLNAINSYELQLSTGKKHAFSLDLTNITGY